MVDRSPGLKLKPRGVALFKSCFSGPAWSSASGSRPPAHRVHNPSDRTGRRDSVARAASQDRWEIATTRSEFALVPAPVTVTAESGTVPQSAGDTRFRTPVSVLMPIRRPYKVHPPVKGCCRAAAPLRRGVRLAPLKQRGPHAQKETLFIEPTLIGALFSQQSDN